MANHQQSEIGITIRLTAEKLAALDEHADRLRAKAGAGVHVTRTEALRNLIDRGLAEAGRSR